MHAAILLWLTTLVASTCTPVATLAAVSRETPTGAALLPAPVDRRLDSDRVGHVLVEDTRLRLVIEERLS